MEGFIGDLDQDSIERNTSRCSRQKTTTVREKAAAALLGVFTDGVRRNGSIQIKQSYSIQRKKSDLYIVQWNLALTLWNLAS
ncbi:hypothetical protein PPMP20_16420 [Paraburkholderia phymatum]|uniref:hypothetical protein n=1 Tax=Paraburkholderia phymatum TaxID=148447 RepID=UPI0012FD356B|nr:hypothetical protein [Paraburkholderia phymatum]